MQPAPLLHRCLAELAGTFVLVFFGTGAVFVAVLTGALSGLFQVAIVWGLAIGLAIHAFGAISGAHLNPAVTLALMAYRGFRWRDVLPYVVAQLVGAFLASALLYMLFSGLLTDFETTHEMVRGQPGSQRSAMMFGEYTPNPGMLGSDAAAFEKVSLLQGFAAEGVGTAILVFMIFAMTDPTNRSRPDGNLAAPAIGLTVTALICLIAPLTQAGFNPARDLPRATPFQLARRLGPDRHPRTTRRVLHALHPRSSPGRPHRRRLLCPRLEDALSRPHHCCLMPQLIRCFSPLRNLHISSM